MSKCPEEVYAGWSQDMASTETKSELAAADTSLPAEVVKRSRWQRFRLKMSSQVYRDKFYYMIGLYLTSFFSGWVVGLKGPAFLDLQQITGVGVSQGAAFFTAAAVGAGIGNFFGGAAYDRYNRHIVLFISMSLYGVTCAIIPWCSAYWSMVLIFLLHELVTGAARSGSNVEIVEEWGDEGKPFMQALHFSFSMGATISPFILDPFLSQEITDPLPNTTTDPLTTTTSPVLNSKGPDIETLATPKRYTESLIHWPFLICGILTIVSSFVFLIKYFHDKRRGRGGVRRSDLKKNAETGIEEPHRQKRTLPLRLLLITLFLFGVFYFFLDEVEDTSPSFLSTFVVKQMDFSKTEGNRLSSAFWASYTAGRGIGIILVNFVTHVQLFTLCCIVLCLGQVGLLLSGLYLFGTGIWISIVAIGLAISVVFPASLTWAEKELVQLSGKLLGIIYVALALGGLANPQIIGATMELYSPMWYSYVLCVESFLFAMTFLSLVMLVRKVLNKHRIIEDKDPEDTKV